MNGLLNFVTRRNAQSIFALTLVAASGAFAAGTAKIGTVIWIGYGPYYVADALDLYKKSGFKVSLQVFSDPALIPPAIEGGAVATGASAIGIEADSTRSIEIERMIHLINEALGPIDILVNNAGVLLEKSFLKTTEEDWDYVVDTDLKGIFLCSKAVLPGMVKRSSGIVINVASELGVVGRALYGPYCAAKAGVIGLTRSMAREFAPAIRVNAIAPGPVNTPMLSLQNMSPEVLKRERDIPARRVGEPEEIAGTALFLASDLASFYYGQVLSPNGGAWIG